MHADALCLHACPRKTRCNCPPSTARARRHTSAWPVLRKRAATRLKRDGSLQIAVACGATAKGLSQCERGAAYNLVVDDDVHAIGADPECTRAQIVYVLTAINPEV